MTGRDVVVRPVAAADRAWLTRQGWSRWMVGEQYHWAETPLQLYIAPARAWGAVHGRRPGAVVEVDGRRAGFIGANPLSGNLEYFVQPAARGGIGRSLIGAFLTAHRRGDRSRYFFVAHKNERSYRALLGALESIDWSEGPDYWVQDHRLGWRVHVRAEP